MVHTYFFMCDMLRISSYIHNFSHKIDIASLPNRKDVESLDDELGFSSFEMNIHLCLQLIIVE
jgi:hypothetical protein